MTRRLLLSYLTITVIVLILLEVPLALFFRQREIDRLTVDAERDATVLATYYEDALEDETDLEPQAAVDYADRTGARVVVVDAAGISRVDTDADSPRDLSTRPEIRSALEGQRSSGSRHSDTLDTDLLYVAVPVASGGVVHGGLRITLDREEVDERIWRFWTSLVAIAVVILVVMGGVGWVIARSVTRPIRRLQDAATRFSAGDLAPTTPARGAPPELAELERALNAMAVRLADLLARQRSFVADASHQLRTPLTALRLQVENLQSDLVASASTHDTADVAAELDRVIVETDRLSELVDHLLQLARAEAPASPEPTELTSIIRDRVDTWTAAAETCDVHLSADLPPRAVHATVVPGGLEQVLDNLIDNALKVAPGGSTVHVELEDGPNEVGLAVRDEGPGLTPAELAHALERFWRADASTGGTGLGLAIVRALAEASGGSVRLEPNRPTGVAAVVRLPTAVAPDPGHPTPHPDRVGQRRC